MPGYQLHFSDALKATNQKFICPSCGWILRDAVQTVCGHLYCNTCLADKQRHDNSVCITCGKSLKQTHQCPWFPDNFLRREIADLNVSCPNAACGCHWGGKLRLFDDHQNECSYRPMPCGNYGCTSDVPACQLLVHEERECRYRRVVCQHCNSPETVESLQDHLEICPDVPVSCAKCGKDNILRSQLNGHRDVVHGDCDGHKCPFSGAYGCPCDDLMSPEALTRHLTRHLTEGFDMHFRLLMRLLERCSHQSHVEAAPPPEGSVRQDLRTAEAEIVGHSWALSTHYNQLQDLDGEVQTLVNSLTEVVDGLEQVSITNAAELQEMSALKNRVERLEATVERQDVTINTLLQLVGALFRRPQHSLGNR